MCLAIPGRIVEVAAGNFGAALVEVLGVRRKVDLSLLAEESPEIGDWVLIHVGFAMSKISERDAEDQLRVLRILGEDQAAMEEVQGYGSDGLGAPPKVESG